MESNNMIPYGYGSKPWQLMNPKVASKWMFIIPLKLIIIGFGPIPYDFQFGTGNSNDMGIPTLKKKEFCGNQ
jgi:hypothetical protein